MTTLRTLVFRLLPHCYQIVYGTPWTTEQADAAESLVAQIRALSIVARNGGPGVETQQPCGIEASDGANSAVPGPEGASMRECPFCRSTRITTRVRPGAKYNPQYVATCHGCNAEGPQGEHATSDAAIAAWNRRVEPEPIDDDGRVGPWSYDEARRMLR